METSLLFSDVIDCTAVSWSPDGLFLAHDSSSLTNKARNQTEIIIRDVKSQLGFFKAFSYKSPLSKSNNINCLNWSSDSCYIAVGLYDAGLIHIFCLDSFNFKCKIEVGDEIEGVGLIDFCWSPRSRHVLTTASDYVQLTIWPLTSPATSRNILYVRDIVPIQNFKSFTEDGSKFALAQYDVDLDGRPCNDEANNKIIRIYNVSNWRPEIMFHVKVKDLIGIKWCPNQTSNVLLLWDSPLFSNLYLYSDSGDLIKHVSPDPLSAGIKTIEWSMTGQFLIFSNHDNLVRILNGLSYGNLLEEKFDTDLPRLWPDCLIYKETKQDGLIDDSLIGMAPDLSKYKYSVCKKIHHSEVKHGTKNLTDSIRFSWDSKYVCIYLRSFGNILWIWDLENIKVCSILVQKYTISDFKWDPKVHRLCICTDNTYIYFWTPAGSYISKIPDDELTAEALDWNSGGSQIIISSSKRMSCCTFKCKPETQKH